MLLEYVPLLRLQRDLYRLPRDRTRFEHYLRTMLDATGRKVALPLVAMNPMAREHVPALLDGLIAIDADKIAAEATREAAKYWPDLAGLFRVALVVADDAGGGWTSRAATEFFCRFGGVPKDEWIVALLWSSEPACPLRTREQVFAAVYRTAYQIVHGPAETLSQMLAQEGQTLAAAGVATPLLDAEELAYTAAVLQPHLESRDRAVQIACFCGDRLAQKLGHAAQGVSDWAGLAWGIAEARRRHLEKTHSSKRDCG